MTAGFLTAARSVNGRLKSALRIFRRKKERKVSKEDKSYNNARILVNKKFYINN